MDLSQRLPGATRLDKLLQQARILDQVDQLLDHLNLFLTLLYGKHEDDAGIQDQLAICAHLRELHRGFGHAKADC